MNDAQPTIKAPLGGIENVAILQGRILDLEQQVNDQIERAVSAETDLALEQKAHQATKRLSEDRMARIRQLENFNAQMAKRCDNLIAERNDLKAHNLQCTARIVDLEDQVESLQEVIDKAAENVGETMARLGQI